MRNLRPHLESPVQDHTRPLTQEKMPLLLANYWICSRFREDPSRPVTTKMNNSPRGFLLTVKLRRAQVTFFLLMIVYMVDDRLYVCCFSKNLIFLYTWDCSDRVTSVLNQLKLFAAAWQYQKQFRLYLILKQFDRVVILPID